nr:mechanosensitive ion channel [Paracoccus saliphilus]
MVTGLGVGSLVAGLAFKRIFANYLAGLLILLRLSFREPVPLDGAQVSQR